MTAPAAQPVAFVPRLRWRDAGLWASAAALALGAHVAVAYAVQTLSQVDRTDGGPPPAQSIEITPIAAMPASEAQVAVLQATQPDQSEPVPAPEASRAEPVEETQPVVDPMGQAVAAVAPDEAQAAQSEIAQPADQPPPAEIVPDMVEAVAPEVAVPPPRPKPDIAQDGKKPVRNKKATEASANKKPAAKRADDPRAKPPRKVSVPKAVPTAGGRFAARGQDSRADGGATFIAVRQFERLESRLHGWIARHTRYPSAARPKRASGQAYVVVTLDASGRVLSTSLFRSSGNGDLDRAALSALRGATVPAPPAEKVGSPIVAPFTFARD